MMLNTDEVIKAATALAAQKDDNALEVQVGMRARAIERDESLGDDLLFEPKYDNTTMGALDDIKALGRRITRRWNKELHGAVCGNSSDNQAIRKSILDSLSLSEAAVIGAVATCLLTLNVPGALAAAIAPIIVRRFIWPAKDELCQAWAERLSADQ